MGKDRSPEACFRTTLRKFKKQIQCLGSRVLAIITMTAELLSFLIWTANRDKEQIKSIHQPCLLLSSLGYSIAQTLVIFWDFQWEHTLFNKKCPNVRARLTFFPPGWCPRQCHLLLLPESGPHYDFHRSLALLPSCASFSIKDIKNCIFWLCWYKDKYNPG